MGINKKSIMFNINKYNKIMSHIDEYDDKDIKITPLTDADIFSKIKDGGYSYELNDEQKACKKKSAKKKLETRKIWHNEIKINKSERKK